MSQELPQEAAKNLGAPTPKRRLIWHNILFMTLNPLAAVIFTPIYLASHGFSWGLLAFLLITYTISNMSITVGYHRYFSHRTYNVSPWMEALYIFFGSGAFQGSILQWCSDHRRHHREVDTGDDPYTITKGFWYAHVLWMFRRDPHPESRIYPRDLAQNRLIFLQHKYYPFIATFVGFIVPGLIGWACGFGFWGGLIIGGSLRIFLSQQSTFLINSAAHTFGRRPYTDKNTARDSFVMAFLTFGEGYHNYHHFFQADYRNGIRWYQWDPTKWWIRSLAILGIATKLKKARKEEIFKARIAMEERQLVSRGAPSERVAQVKAKLVEAQVRMRQLHDEYLASYKSAKAAFRLKRAEMAEQMRANRAGREMRAELRLQIREQLKSQVSKLKTLRRAQLREVKTEFKTAYREWRTFRRATSKAAA